MKVLKICSTSNFNTKLNPTKDVIYKLFRVIHGAIKLINPPLSGCRTCSYIGCITLVLTGVLAQTGNRRLDYDEACKHGIGGWIMVKPANTDRRMDYSDPGKHGIGGWIMVKPANTK